MKTTTILFLSVAILFTCIQTQDLPPKDIITIWEDAFHGKTRALPPEYWFKNNQRLKLRSFNDNVALYYDNGMQKSITWPLNIISQIWAYTKATYGDFGGQQRLFAALHTKKYSSRHSTFFDKSESYRNVVDIQKTGSWSRVSNQGLAAITYEIAHIVEGASKGVQNSPSVSVWHDGKWAEIFTYDVFNKLGWTNAGKQWLKDKQNAAADNFPRRGTHWFRDWFYPIYRDYGETDVLNRYFELLSANFPKHSFNRTSPYFKYDRNLNFGEFVYFWSGAAQTDLRELAVNAFGQRDERGRDWTLQFEQAKIDFPDVFNNDPEPDSLDITVEIIDNPEAQDFPQRAKDLIMVWDSFITRVLASDGFTSPRSVKFVFQKGLSAPAYTQDGTISVNVDYINDFPDDLGMMIHEYTHIVQQYPQNQFGVDAGWLTEGIADYIRYIYYEPNHDNPNDPPATDSWFKANQPLPSDDYRSGYGNAARFIYWIGQKFAIGDLLQQLNEEMRAGTYQDSVFEDLTGQSLDDLWSTYAVEIGLYA